MTLSGWESVFFWIFSIAAILAGLLTVMARNAVHSALFLISSLVSVAALFILLGAEFIAGVQILVYVGGVMVLFLFVIMLVNVGAEEEGRAAPFVGVVADGAAVRFDDPVADRQTEAGALADRLGREERLEQLRLVFRGDSRAIVLHFEPDAFAGV